MTTLQERRHADCIVQIERMIARREKIITALIRLSSKIASTARQARRYENIIPKAPPKPVAEKDKRPAKEIMKPVRFRRRR